MSAHGPTRSAPAATIAPRTPEDVRDAVASSPRVRISGGASKAAGPTPDGALHLSTRELSGILEYDPSEYTFTALAGTSVADVATALAGHGQMLPFDPPLMTRGATLGGTVAAGLSGSGRYRNGGVRDFILGVGFVDGYGRIVHGGGKVVKNAAGFDFPKLMVGSLGRLGVLLELTFKVFPRPDAQATLRVDAPSVEEAVAIIRRLARSTWDLAALDLLIDGPTMSVDIRLAGLGSALAGRLDRLRAFLGRGDVLGEDDDTRLWAQSSDFGWVPTDSRLIKIPLTPGRIAAFDEAIGCRAAARRYAAGGQVAWLAWREPVEGLSSALEVLSLTGQIVLGSLDRESPLLGCLDGGAFGTRVKAAMDPTNRFG